MRLHWMSWHEICEEMGVHNRHVAALVANDAFFDDYRNTRAFSRARTTDEEVEYLRYLIEEEGLTAWQAGLRMGGLSRAAVHKRMERAGISSPRYSRVEAVPIEGDEAERVLSYLKDGYSYAQTARFTNHAPGTIIKRFPGYDENAPTQRAMRILERKTMPVINDVWGLNNAT